MILIKNILFKFIIRLNEDISLNITDLFYYILNKNVRIKLDILFKLDELLRLNNYIFNNILNNLDNKLVYSIIDKYNENFKSINNFIDKNYVKENISIENNNDILYLQEILLTKMIFYNILNNYEEYIVYLKNESLYFNNDLFKDISLDIKKLTNKEKY